MYYYLSLGTNLGNKADNLHRAVNEIEKRIGHVTALSAFHATEPWGFHSEHTFLNAACRVDTPLTPHEVLHLTQQIERDLGRTRKSEGGVYHDRLIDIDLLLAYTDEGTPLHIESPDLQIPHPLMQQRDFVMIPLREICSDASNHTI